MSVTIRDVTGNPDNFVVMKELIRIQKCRVIDEFKIIPNLPQSAINDLKKIKEIYSYLMNQFEFHKMLIKDRFALLEVFVFLFKKGTRVFKFQFTNNMNFCIDVIIICYLSQTLCRFRSQKKCEIVYTLAKLLNEKYGIDIGMIREPKNFKYLTPFEISICFPSISLSTFYYTDSSVPFKLLPSFHLPKIIFAPMIISILPKFVKNPPIAIFIAIFIRSDYLLKPRTSQMPLMTIYQRILACYNSKFLPESLKLFLCKKWKIVIKKKKRYKFASCFTAYRRKAKNLISELRPNDPSLKDILSRI